MDCDDYEPLAERLPKHLPFRPTAQAFDDDAISVDSRQRALRPDSESVDLPLGLGHPADRGIRDGETPPLGFFADHVPHPDDREGEILRHYQDFFLPTTRHSRDADDPHR